MSYNGSSEYVEEDYGQYREEGYFEEGKPAPEFDEETSAAILIDPIKKLQQDISQRFQAFADEISKLQKEHADLYNKIQKECIPNYQELLENEKKERDSMSKQITSFLQQLPQTFLLGLQGLQ